MFHYKPFISLVVFFKTHKIHNHYSQFINSDAVRSITCKAALIAQEQNEKLIVDNSKRSQVKDYTAGFSTKNSAQINNGKSITKD